MSDYTSKLTADGIISDIIDQFEIYAEIEAVFPSSKQAVDFGNLITPVDSKEAPEVSVKFTKPVKDDVTYTLVVTDPDAPRRDNPTLGEVAHALFTDLNLDGSENSIGKWQKIDFTKVTTILSYIGPGPPKGTGLHRYTFILYSSPKGIKVTGPSQDNRRTWGSGIPGFGVRDWYKKEKIEMIVLGANFFNSKND